MPEENELIKIATLNFNGETFWSINRRPRLPQKFFDIMKIKEKLIALIETELGGILEGKSYDIIAIQELINSSKEKDKIEKIIKKHGYILMTPEVDSNTHFTVGFIVKDNKFKKSIIKKCIGCPGNILSKNRVAILDIIIKDKEYSIINMHVNNHKICIPASDGNVILLGDLNACNNSQSSDGKGCNSEFLSEITKSYDAMDINNGNQNNYTWKSNGRERKLDHIFVSKQFNGFEIKSVEKIDSVNFFYDKEKGFTDHSMIVMTFAIT